jgi:hypothetical protein
MLELVPPGLNIDFISKAKIFITISVVVILIWPVDRLCSTGI